MKTLLTTFFLLANAFVFAQPWKTIKGNGNTKSETRTVSDFNGVASSGSMDVEISYGKSNSVEVIADENLLPYIETTVEGDLLHIKTKKNANVNTRNKVVVKLMLTRVTALKLSGSGKIDGEGNFSNNGTTVVSVSGSGNIDFEFDKISNLEIAVSGSGNIELEGRGVNNISAAIAGSGNIDCSDVACNNVTARISGSGNIKVNARKNIDAKVSGSGHVYYKGNANVVNTNTSGRGRVIKMKP